MKNKRMTIHRIAELAGVNASTVSRVFNPNCRNSISAPVSQKILAIAEKYEYAPKNSARSLACGQSFNLGILLHDLERDFTSPAYSLVISEFCREAVRHGYQAVLLPVENGNFDQGTARHIRGGNADAYLAGYPLMGTESMQELKKRNIPVVSYISDKLWDSSSLRGSVVYLDNAPAFEQMFTTVREYGFSDFALFCPEGKFNSSRFVFYEQYHSYGLNLKERILFKAESSPMLLLERARTAAKAQIKRILKHQLIICSTDLVALGLC
ncbi:MAG: LacI family DNA-binding transcriptional regulator, partial [Victivallales bacterium]